MNASIQVAAVVLAAVAGSVTTVVTRPAADASERADASTLGLDVAELAQMTATVERLADRLEQTEMSLTSMQARAAGGRVAIGLSQPEIEAYLAQRLDAGTLTAAGLVAASTFGPDEIQAALDRLDELSDSEDQQLVWRELYEDGNHLAVLAALEARTPDDDTNAQAELGLANLWCMFQAQGQGDMMRFFEGADSAFKRSLELDDHNWGARFARAIMLTNLPVVSGRANEAIAELQTLIAQQQEVEAHPRHAQSFLYLGNMYQQIGETEKAHEAWREGNLRFPDDATLAAQLERIGN